MMVCLIPIGQACYLSASHEKQQEELRNLLGKEEKPRKAENLSDSNTEHKKILDKFQKLYRENTDLVGWLTIDNTDIDYPVMQCEDDEYYLNHNFYQKKDKYGCLYVKKSADLITPGTNFIIYGHNMRDGSMFGSLDKYRDAGFGKEHSVISFDTLYEERTYEIMAVFLSRVFYREEEGFRYYEFYQAENEEEFEYFYNNVKTMALYDTGVEAGYGDTFITLTTCSYHVEDGRLVIVARRMTDSR